jgi:hypothetical protein
LSAVYEWDDEPPDGLWYRDTLAQIAANPPESHGWIVRRLWPADAYGVIAAESKAGKSLQAQDLAVSIATGSPFLGRFPIDRTGPVLMYVGEGGQRSTFRRLSAICLSKGINPLGVRDLTVVFRAPKLTDSGHVEQMERDAEAVGPVAIVLDPLYLSLGGTSSSGLSEMGVVLGEAQRVAEAAGAALFVVHHWNQTGKGNGFGRMSGAGPEEWGRVLWSIAVADRKEDEEHDAGTIVDLTFSVRGGEIPDANFGVRRNVWVDDPDELASPMHYEVEATDITFGRAERKILNSRDRMLAILTDDGSDKWWSPSELQDVDANWANSQPGMKPLTMRTVKDACQKLHEASKVDRAGIETTGYSYRAARR